MHEIIDGKSSDNKIAVLYAAGEIFNGDEYQNISEKYVEYTSKDLAEDDDIKQ